MNMMTNFNRTIQYLETVLDKEVDKKKVAQLSGYSYGMFCRLFSMLTDMTLSEYLRKRRLSEAARYLRERDDRILDFAICFGYESSDSFGTAFKQFHRFTPSEVRKGKPYKVFSPIQCTLRIEGGRKMNVRIEKKKAFTVVGVQRKNMTSSLCGEVWNRLFRILDQEKVEEENLAYVGVCYDMEELESHEVLDTNNINYMAGYLSDDVEDAEKLGLDFLNVEEEEYGV